MQQGRGGWGRWSWKDLRVRWWWVETKDCQAKSLGSVLRTRSPGGVLKRSPDGSVSGTGKRAPAILLNRKM